MSGLVPGENSSSGSVECKISHKRSFQIQESMLAIHILGYIEREVPSALNLELHPWLNGPKILTAVPSPPRFHSYQSTTFTIWEYPNKCKLTDKAPGDILITWASNSSVATTTVLQQIQAGPVISKLLPNVILKISWIRSG